MPPKILHNALNAGATLHRYRIERSLARGGFGITYLAEDESLNRQVVIKEYFPLELAVRDTDATIQPLSSEEASAYKWGLERFVSEARVLAKFNHRNIVRVLEVFEANNTAYIVMNYEEGEPLKDLLERRKTMPEEELVELIFPIMEGLEQIHAKGFLHRDIKPANILIRNDGTPLLLDFGSAREALSQRTRTFTTLYSPGFAPIEQYAGPSGQQGPWTDIYGLGATLYCAIVGHPPAEALQRSHGIVERQNDPFVPLQKLPMAAGYSKTFLRALDHSLAFKTSERPQTIAAWREEFSGTYTAGNTRPDLLSLKAEPDERGRSSRSTTQRPRYSAEPETDWRRVTWLIVLSITIGAGLGSTLFHFFRKPESSATVSNEPKSLPTQPPAPTVAQTEPTAAPLPTAVADPFAETLARANDAILAGRLISPEGNNALTIYRSILAQQPNHAGATEALQRLREIMESSALDAANRGSDSEAFALISKLKEFGALSPTLQDIESKITTKRQQAQQALAQQQSLGRRQEFLEQARQALAQGQYQKASAFLDQATAIEGPVDPAIGSLKQELDKRRTMAQLLQQARTAIGQDRLDVAQNLMDQAAKIFPKARSVLLLRKELDQKRKGNETPVESIEPTNAQPPVDPKEAAVQKLIDTALIAMDKNDWAKARAALSKANELAPDSPDVQLMNGELESRAKAASANDGVVVPVRKGAPRTEMAPVAEQETNPQPIESTAPKESAASPDRETGVVVAVPKGSRSKPPVAAAEEGSTGSESTTAGTDEQGVVVGLPKNSATESAPVENRGSVKIQSASTSVPTARPGDTIRFFTEYNLLLPPDVKFEFVEVTWTLKQNGRALGEKGEFSATEKSGVHQAYTELTLPERMKPGKFAVEHRLDTALGQDIAVSYFTVLPR